MVYFNESETMQHEHEYEQEYENENEHEQDHDNQYYDDSFQYDDQIDDVKSDSNEEIASIQKKKIALITKSKPKISATKSEATNFDDSDLKSMIKYRLNWFGLPFSFFAIYFYGRLIFEQMSAKLPTVIDDLMPVQMALKVRYIGALVYFVACLIYRPFVYEYRNSEGPLIVATVLELYYMLNCKEGKESVTVIELLIPVSVVTLCFLRRKFFLRTFMNPWSKDKSELIKLIRSAKETAGLLNNSSL